MTTEKYRVEGTRLFEYSPERNAYVFVYRNDRAKSKKQLIREYENYEEERAQR